MEKEAIHVSDFTVLEKIAHEIGMAISIEKFKESFKCGYIEPTREASFIIDVYSQYKKLAIDELNEKYQFFGK